MRRICIWISLAALLLALATGVSAATGASNVGAYATVSADGSCQVTLTVTLNLEQSLDSLYFPIPLNATDVTLNGSRVLTSKADGARRVDLSDLVGSVVGSFSVNIHYTVKHVVQKTEADTLELQVPLLSGFVYPVEKMDFSITLPGAVEGTPAFYSGYHQTGIEKDMVYAVNGATVSGSFPDGLKDHETLMMKLTVSDTMFPQAVVEVRNTDYVYTAIGICAGAAVLYWLLFLRALPFRRQYSAAPPEGYTAGELGCVLSCKGVDLTMMVFTWAQLGYILIQIDRHDRVLLHKRMDMGNERGETERFYFRKLFGKRQLVDTTGYHYAQLCRMAQKRPAGLQELLKRKTGNPRIFRGLVSGVGLFSGIALGNAISGGAALQDFLMVLLAAAGAISAWVIQGWCADLFLRSKRRLWIGLGCCAGWLIFGLVAGQFSLALWTVLGLLLAGGMMSYGGRRTDWGRQMAAQILGLRHYLRSVPENQLQRINNLNPEYFFSLAPYAMALGSDEAFAKRMGSDRLPGCPYLTTGMDAHMTAEGWSKLMRFAAERMDARNNQLTTEKLLRILDGLRR